MERNWTAYFLGLISISFFHYSWRFNPFVSSDYPQKAFLPACTIQPRLQAAFAAKTQKGSARAFNPDLGAGWLWEDDAHE